MAGNPRVEELRKRLEKEPGSRIFAQLAEELRKDGDLEEAIRVSRDGLQKHPQYPSARITLGRALLDTGDAEAAHKEFELVLKAAPDNILASRYLGEALEALGDIEGARKRYRVTLTLSPGDKFVLGRLEALDAAGAPAPAAWPGGTAAVKTTVPPLAVKAPPPPPPPVQPAQAPPPPPASRAPEPPAVKLAEASEDFELDRPQEAAAAAPAPPPPPAPAVAARAAEPTPDTDENFDFDVQPPAPAPAAPFEATLRVPLELPAEPTPLMPGARPAAGGSAPASPRDEAEVEPIASPTLAELYFNQGFTRRAVEVYQKVVQREPGNEKARARLAALEATLARPPAVSPAAPHDRRGRLEATIDKLDALRRALRGVNS